MVEEIVQKKPSHSWWFKGHSTPKRSPWLQSTLSELDKKTTAMLKLIEEDAESFAQRAEMYYKKRPELINMVEDFYRTHRSLAERFDLLKIESKTRSSIYQPNKISTTDMVEKPYDSYSDKSEMYPESEVDDPEEVEQEETLVHKQPEDNFEGDDGLGESEVDDHEEEEEEETRVHEGIEDNLEDDEGLGKSEVDDSEENEEEKETQIHNLTKGEENEVLNGKDNENEVMKLREELEKLKEENKVQREQLMQKDEEKREAIRQLSLSMEFLRENLKSSKNAIKESYNMKKNQFDLNKLKELISGKLFGGGSSKTSTNLVAL